VDEIKGFDDIRPDDKPKVKKFAAPSDGTFDAILKLLNRL
jgi:hypothetical protein